MSLRLSFSVLRPFCRARSVPSTSSSLEAFAIRSHDCPQISRRYASTRSRIIPAAGQAPRKPPLFASDIPALDFWISQTKNLGIEDPLPESCLAAAQKYVEVANSSGRGWRSTLEREHGISPFDLYYMGVMIIQSPPSPYWKVGYHMLASASELGFAPSTLTIVKLGLQSNKLGTTQFRAAEQAFSKLVTRRDDPNAMTLQGKILAGKGVDDLALRWFSDAEKVAGEGGWDWKADCLLGKGRILLRRGHKAEAYKAFEVTALELDNPEGYYELAMLQCQGSPEQEKYLQKAAISGVEDACRALGELNLAKASRSSGDEAKHYEKLANEWLAISGDRPMFI